MKKIPNDLDLTGFVPPEKALCKLIKWIKTFFCYLQKQHVDGVVVRDFMSFSTLMETQSEKDGQSTNTNNDAVVQNERPSWDEYFLGLAIAVAQRSHDPRTKHGCIITKDNRIIGTGYNGFIHGVDDESLPREAPTKYKVMFHAECNSLLNCQIRPEGCTAYITGEPCLSCIQQLWQGGIRKVIHLDKHGSYQITEEDRALKELIILQTGMLVIPYKKEIKWLSLNLAGVQKPK